MVLSDEIKERMRVNREKALAIRRKKMEEAAALAAKNDSNSKGVSSSSSSRNPTTTSTNDGESKVVDTKAKAKLEEEEEDVELEEFEVGASPYVTKGEAMQMYCLPQGTLDVCSFIEKENPRNKKWNTMKLFHRCEIRKRARERHGGMDGLINERNKRKRKQFERDLEKSRDIFKRKRT